MSYRTLFSAWTLTFAAWRCAIWYRVSKLVSNTLRATSIAARNVQLHVSLYFRLWNENTFYGECQAPCKSIAYAGTSSPFPLRAHPLSSKRHAHRFTISTGLSSPSEALPKAPKNGLVSISSRVRDDLQRFESQARMRLAGFSSRPVG